MGEVTGITLLPQSQEESICKHILNNGYVADFLAVTEDIAKVAGKATSIPGLGLAAIPFSVYSLSKQVKEYFQNLKAAKTFREKLFWATRGTAKTGQVANEVFKPTLVIAALASSSISSNAAFVAATRALLPITLALSTLGLFASSWNLGRTIQEYRRLKKTKRLSKIFPPQKGKIHEVFFKSCYMPFHQNFDGLTQEQLREKLKKAIRFALFDHSTSLVACICGIAGSVLLIASPGSVIPATVLIGSSSGLSVLSLIAKQFLKEKKHKPALKRAPRTTFLSNVSKIREFKA